LKKIDYYGIFELLFGEVGMKKRIIFAFLIVFIGTIFLKGNESKTYVGAGISYSSDSLKGPFGDDSLNYFHLNISLDVDNAISDGFSLIFNLSIPLASEDYWCRWDQKEKHYMVSGGIKWKLLRNFYISPKIGAYLYKWTIFWDNVPPEEDSGVNHFEEISLGISLSEKAKFKSEVEVFFMLMSSWVFSNSTEKFFGIRFTFYHLI